MNSATPTMHTHRTPDVALWDQYRALREQWVHEDNLVHHRMSWLLVSSGLLFTAYTTMGNAAAAGAAWLRIGFPFFGMAVAALIGVGIFAAMAATDEIRREFERSGLADLCRLAPASHMAHRGRWAARALPFVFGGLWLLALAGSLRG